MTIHSIREDDIPAVVGMLHARPAVGGGGLEFIGQMKRAVARRLSVCGSSAAREMGVASSGCEALVAHVEIFVPPVFDERFGVFSV